ncbi:MAG: Spy/CpxP family protein refolding chaperone [Bacteroidales bacterium]
MKQFKRLTAILVTAMIMFTAADTMAQRNRDFKGKGMAGGPGFNQQCQMIPDLTADQQEELKALRVDQMEQMTQFRNNLTEKRATLRKLQTQENPDMEEINNIIEEMGEIRTEMHKTGAEHHQEIREILTDEQRAFFDARMKNHRRMAEGHGRRPMMGRPCGLGK